ncbi:BN860_13674g1_1 [Zygosaccharomyces bailii CLIB 213]|uniref:BN860_13674g1_1 n=1 Tax=Zygosaccharomyces bailii (strain CLIB 213 / ATCC 58445 / CBS 680 / BCRC 21525 / NBRC 1098 / NCYC 1416 / NRRL Y-2227) TaxID=1333698 RepID=A0A8J2X697_ZYGB2|nr:BN860_13674g1_1 [Zygosaccharomyces bailii CLIB 213]
MTAEVYPNDYFGGPDKLDSAQNNANECKWLIEEIIKPELPNIIDNVERCLDMLQSEQVFRIPISSGCNETSDRPSVKGIVARQAGQLVDFQAVVRFPEFHNGKPILFKKSPESHFPLQQIETITGHLQTVLITLEDLQITMEPKSFVDKIGQVLELLIKSINLLQNPPRDFSFPDSGNAAMKLLFDDHEALSQTAHHEISLEIVLFKKELCVDFRNLIKVTKKPWCEIDPGTGKSFGDKIKDQLTTDRSKNLSSVLKENGVQIEQATFLNNLMSNFSAEITTLPQAQNYLNRCVTFNDKVVIEIAKVALTTSDPFLISTSTKLSSLENSVSNYFTNLEV